MLLPLVCPCLQENMRRNLLCKEIVLIFLQNDLWQNNSYWKVYFVINLAAMVYIYIYSCICSAVRLWPALGVLIVRFWPIFFVRFSILKRNAGVGFLFLRKEQLTFIVSAKPNFAQNSGPTLGQNLARTLLFAMDHFVNFALESKIGQEPYFVAFSWKTLAKGQMSNPQKLLTSLNTSAVKRTPFCCTPRVRPNKGVSKTKTQDTTKMSKENGQLFFEKRCCRREAKMDFLKGSETKHEKAITIEMRDYWTRS